MRTIDAIPAKQGRPATYDWDALLTEGAKYVLVQGEDFDSKVESFTSRAQQVARERGLRFTYRTEGEYTVNGESIPLLEGEVAVEVLRPDPSDTDEQDTDEQG